MAANGAGTREDPWILTTPSGGSEYSAYRDEAADPPALVVNVGNFHTLAFHLVGGRVAGLFEQVLLPYVRAGVVVPESCVEAPP